MMAREMKKNVMASATLPRKRFKILFDLESGVMYGGDFELEAFNKASAIRELEARFPGAQNHVKDVRILH